MVQNAASISAATVSLSWPASTCSTVLCSVKCEDLCISGHCHLDQAPRVLLQHRPTLVLEGGAPTNSIVISIIIKVLLSQYCHLSIVSMSIEGSPPADGLLLVVEVAPLQQPGDHHILT